MPSSDTQKQYANEWYAKNKERLKLLPHRKEAKKISDRKYYLKNADRLKKKTKEWKEANTERYTKTKKEYCSKNRDQIILQRKEKRSTAAYKAYMKEYRRKNKEKISKQEREAGRAWIKKQIESISDNYIITLLTNVKVGIFKTHAEARAHPEIIELRRSEILLKRIKKQIKSINQCPPKKP